VYSPPQNGGFHIDTDDARLLSPFLLSSSPLLSSLSILAPNFLFSSLVPTTLYQLCNPPSVPLCNIRTISFFFSVLFRQTLARFPTTSDDGKGRRCRAFAVDLLSLFSRNEINTRRLERHFRCSHFRFLSLTHHTLTNNSNPWQSNSTFTNSPGPSSRSLRRPFPADPLSSPLPSHLAGLVRHRLSWCVTAAPPLYQMTLTFLLQATGSFDSWSSSVSLLRPSLVSRSRLLTSRSSCFADRQFPPSSYQGRRRQVRGHHPC
jgi:hypothetical protein